MGGDRHGQNIAQCWPSVLIGDNPYFNLSNVPIFVKLRQGSGKDRQGLVIKRYITLIHASASSKYSLHIMIDQIVLPSYTKHPV